MFEYLNSSVTALSCKVLFRFHYGEAEGVVAAPLATLQPYNKATVQSCNKATVQSHVSQSRDGAEPG